jgi:hypothetical protein
MAAAMQRRTVVVVCLLLAIVGCRKAGLQVEFVEGIVLLDGKPVEGGIIGVSPAGAAGVPAVGRTDARGIFHLTAQQGGGPGRGVPVGEYRLSVTKIAYDTPTGKPPDDGDITGLAIRHFVPQDYESSETSGLVLSVGKGGGRSDKYRFELRSDFKGVPAGKPAVK